MNLLLFLVLTFHSAQWSAEPVQWNLGTWQRINGPAPELIPKLEYDSQGGYWEVLLEGGWYPLREGDRIEVDQKGVIRVFAGVVQ